MDREQKKEAVAAMNAQFERTSIVVVFHYIGMTVGETDEVRRRVREVGARFQVTKNRLTLRALEGTRHLTLSPHMKGPTAIVCADDPVAAAKAVLATTKANPKLVVIGASVAGQIIDRNGLSDLAALPSLDEFRAKIIGLLAAPATRLVTVLPRPATDLVSILQASPVKLAGVLRAKSEQGESA